MPAKFIIQNLQKSYKKEIIFHSLKEEFPLGQVVGILGLGSSGKSTLLKIIAGMEKSCAGAVFINQGDSQKSASIKHAVAFAGACLTPGQTVYQALQEGVSSSSLKKFQHHSFIMKMAQEFFLIPLLERKLATLSNSELDSVAIAQALSQDSAIILCDDLLASTDHILQQFLGYKLRDYAKKNKALVLYTTAKPDTISNFLDSCVVLNKGYFEQTGTLQDIYDFPNSIAAATLLGPINLIECPVIFSQKDQLSIKILNHLSCVIQGKGGEFSKGLTHLTLGLRPEYITLGLHALGSHAPLLLDSVVTGIEKFQNKVYIHAGLADQVLKINFSSPDPLPQIGQSLTLGINPLTCHFFDNQGMVLQKMYNTTHNAA